MAEGNQDNPPKTHYEYLGVQGDATPADIRRNYRRLVRELHPDKNSGVDPEGIIAALKAYEVLSNPDKRKAYDKQLDSERRMKQPKTTSGKPDTTQDSPTTKSATNEHADRNPSAEVPPLPNNIRREFVEAMGYWGYMGYENLLKKLTDQGLITKEQATRDPYIRDLLHKEIIDFINYDNMTRIGELVQDGLITPELLRKDFKISSAIVNSLIQTSRLAGEEAYKRARNRYVKLGLGTSDYWDNEVRRFRY